MLRPLLHWVVMLVVLMATSIGAVASTSSSSSWSPNEQIPVEVGTRLGTVRGREETFLNKRVRSFLSVPFAEPPTGENRFKPPRPKKPWPDILQATSLSKACFQGRDMYNTSFWGSEMWNANTEVSEDCLYMNIWAPADAYNLTVMVWLFGGGYYSGSPSLILYDGRALAITGSVVVVNINYRVGPFGYLYLGDDEAPGNMGMLDQQMALYWIRDNIFAFGGNPNRVTLFGESAGAASIVAHLIAPASVGLFRNGILQSGSLDNKWSMESPKRAKAKAMKLAELVHCNSTTTKMTIKCLRKTPAQTLVDNIWNVGLAFLEFPFVIVSRDRNFFKHKDAFTALRTGQYTKTVNLMFGINHDEGNFWNIYNLPEYFDKTEQPEITREEMHDCVERAFASQPLLVRSAAKFVYSDPNCTTANERSVFYAEQVNQMVGDYFFTCDSLWFADQLSGPNRQARVFVYYFDENSSANPWPKWTGVMHGYEIEYVFGVPLYNETAGYTRREKVLSDKVIQYWSSFAHTGLPRLRDGKATDVWPEYEVHRPRWQLLKGGSHVKPISARKRAECALWRRAKDIEYHAYSAEVTAAAAVCSGTVAVLLVAVAQSLLF